MEFHCHIESGDSRFLEGVWIICHTWNNNYEFEENLVSTPNGGS